MLKTLLGRNKYQEAMSDEHPLIPFFLIQFSKNNKLSNDRVLVIKKRKLSGSFLARKLFRFVEVDDMLNPPLLFFVFKTLKYVLNNNVEKTTVS